MRKLKKFCGRYVRLKNAVFRTVLERAHRKVGLENLFVVAAISGGMDKLICYGSDMRVVVSPCDVVMV